MSVRNIGIIAHIDAGKTTVSERILYYTHREYRMGEVDSGTATMDWMPEEQQRGITITAAVTTVEWNKFRLNLIDTPGHVDFTAEVERALRVLDGAIGIFCGTAGVQAQSETVWRQADRYRVPRIAFINKLDRVGSDFFGVVEAIRTRLHANAVPLQIPLGREKEFEGVVDLIERRLIRFDAESLGDKLLISEVDESLRPEMETWRDKLIEAVAEADDELLERYLGGEEVSESTIKQAVRRGTLARKITPVLCGAALRNKGIQPLLDAVCDYLPAPEDMKYVVGIQPTTNKETKRALTVKEHLSALVFKAVADPHGGIVYLRVYSGRLEEGQQVWNSRTGKRDRAQKLYLMHSNDRERVGFVEAGNIVAVMGLKDASTGDSLADPSHPILLEPLRFPASVASMAIEPVSIDQRDKLLEALDRLAREDPTLRWWSDQDTGQLVISGMGELHLEIVKDRLLREFRVEAAVGPPRVAYRQTLAAQAEAQGVFEKQIGGRSLFAKVSLRLEPTPDQTLPTVVSELRKETLPLEFHPVIKEAVKEALDSGGLLGFPLIQLRVRILGAEFRPQESTAPAYNAASTLAFQLALDRAGVTILEPVMRFEIQVPDAYYGTVSTDLVRRRAGIQEVTLDHDLRIIRGRVPLSEVFGYSGTLRSLSQGRATISLEPEAYAPVPRDVEDRFRL
jgi:elongation factor G